MNNGSHSVPISARSANGGGNSSLRGGMQRLPEGQSTAATMTITETQTIPNNDEILRLTLVSRPTVRWDEGVQDNEGLGRKSSKRCCIFHKQRDFGESSTDSSADENASDESGAESDGNDGEKKPNAISQNPKIAKKKTKKTTVPGFQRFHA